MPKFVSRAQIMKWREILSEGKDYAEIGKETGWQARTVRKHLESDIRSGEAVQIRQQLFKERLGKHWDMLIDGVLDRLEKLTELSVPGEELDLINSSGTYEREICGAVVSRDPGWALSIEVGGRKTHCWPLLWQHMPKDPLWDAVAKWEDGLRSSLFARRNLILLIKQYLEETTSLSVTDRHTDEPSLTAAAVLEVYREAFSRALGNPPSRPEDTFNERSPGLFEWQSRVIAFDPGRKAEIIKAIASGVEYGTDTQEARECVMTLDNHRKAQMDLDSTIAHFRLLPYLPGVCSVCGRVEV